ncbi:hypothetical protein HY498_01500 [Candidatus Woesearchaeota archaeon]|nr:hypothetical protein [Candidatus Woesearchaeota archaeon]
MKFAEFEKREKKLLGFIGYIVDLYDFDADSTIELSVKKNKDKAEKFSLLIKD